MSDGARPRFGRPRKDLAGAGLAVLMGVQFSFVVILGKGLLRGQPPFALLFFRFAVAAVILAVVTIATRRPLTPEPGERLGLAIAATLGYGSESALYFAALNHGSAATVTLLFYLYPVWVMLTAIALDRRIPAGRLVTALAMAIVKGTVFAVAGAFLATLGSVVLTFQAAFAVPILSRIDVQLPITQASRPYSWARIASNTASASSAGTTASSLPSFAT